MKKLIEELYEMESEKSIQMEALERMLEKRLDELVNEMLEELPEEKKDEFKGRLIGVLLPVKRELYVFGFKSAVHLLTEAMS